MLTPTQLLTLLSQDGTREDMLQAAYRMGLERAAEVCESQGPFREMLQGGWRHITQIDCADAIRAEADATSAKPPRR